MKTAIYQNKDFLTREYLDKRRSMQEIADELGVHLKTIQYWVEKHQIERRNWSEATYVKRNPLGDPFKLKQQLTENEKAMFYLAVGLYLGEGRKFNKGSMVSLGNTDPLIIRVFLKFLRGICGVDEKKIRLSLNIYDDVDLKTALEYWSLVTELPRSSFSKPTIRRARKKGTYKHWSRYGTLSVQVCNSKLMKLICGWCQQCLSIFGDVTQYVNAEVAQKAEHDHGKVGVVGSIPILGSKNYPDYYADKDSITIFFNKGGIL